MAGLRAAEAVVVGIRGLDHDPRPGTAASGPTCRLDHERIGFLRRPVVGEVERQVGIDDPHDGDGLEVETLGDELGPDQDVRPPLGEGLEDLQVGVGSPRGVTVEPEDTRRRP